VLIVVFRYLAPEKQPDSTPPIANVRNGHSDSTVRAQCLAGLGQNVRRREQVFKDVAKQDQIEGGGRNRPLVLQIKMQRRVSPSLYDCGEATLVDVGARYTIGVTQALRKPTKSTSGIENIKPRWLCSEH
jgi:hypothetical protein